MEIEGGKQGGRTVEDLPFFKFNYINLKVHRPVFLVSYTGHILYIWRLGDWAYMFLFVLLTIETQINYLTSLVSWVCWTFFLSEAQGMLMSFK